MFNVIHAEADRDAALPIERGILAAVGASLAGAATTDEDVLVEAAQDADVILSEFMSFPRSVLQRLPQCKAIVGYTIGLDHYDLRAATELGIIIVHTPGFCADEVSNHALMFVLACARRLMALDRKTRQGWWPDGRNLEAALTPMGSLRGETLGLVGFGEIARLVAGKSRAFGMQVMAFDPYASSDLFAQHGVVPASLDEVLTGSDYVSIHAPLLLNTRHMIGAAQLSKMKAGAFLINTSRGAVVDERALVDALRERRIAGAALDVFEHEPPAAEHALFALDNVILTPHAAYCSNAAYTRVRQMAADAALRVLRGEWPTAVANPEVKGRSRMEQHASRMLE
jgi:D-3-phosphoglycerate dehydrogenase